MDMATRVQILKVTVIPIVIGTFDTGTGGVGNKDTCGDHPNYSIAEIGENTKNTKKCPGNLRRLTITWTSVKNHQLML